MTDAEAAEVIHQEIIGSPNFDNPEIRVVDPLQPTESDTFNNWESEAHPGVNLVMPDVITFKTDLLGGTMKFDFSMINWSVIIGAITGLVAIAETAFSGTPKSGAQKKAMVTAASNVILQTAITESTGGQAQTLTTLAPAISGLIDSAASALTDNTGVETISPIVTP